MRGSRGEMYVWGPLLATYRHEHQRDKGSRVERILLTEEVPQGKAFEPDEVNSLAVGESGVPMGRG